MLKTIVCARKSATLAALCAAGMTGASLAGNIGVDIYPSRLGMNSSGSGDDFNYYGQATDNGTTWSAFSIANTSCNIGDQIAEWIDQPNNARNPVISPNLFRIHDGRIEQIGMGWVKHSFCAVNEFTCGSCVGTSCDTLGIGCADTYWAGLNGDQFRIGPRWEINPQGEGPNRVHDDVYLTPDGPNVSGGSAIAGRVIVDHDDIVPGALYVAEIQLVTHDEPLGNRYNNASYRFVNMTTTSISGDAFNGFPAFGQSSVRGGQPAIMAWQEADPSVDIVALTEDNDGNGDGGRFYIGYTATDNGDGTWHYEYAIQNFNSDRGARAFSVQIPDCVNVTNMEFHDIHHHSGDRVNKTTGSSDWNDNISGDDWTMSVSNGLVEWSTETLAENVNANALRWGSLYNFSFDADAPPGEVDGELILFKGGGGAASLISQIGGPTAVCALPCPADCSPDNGDGTFGNGTVNIDDVLAIINDFGSNNERCDSAPDNGDGTFGNGIVNIDDLLTAINAFGDCP